MKHKINVTVEDHDEGVLFFLGQIGKPITLHGTTQDLKGKLLAVEPGYQRNVLQLTVQYPIAGDNDA